MEAQAIQRRRSDGCRAMTKEQVGSAMSDRMKFEESGGLCRHCELPSLKMEYNQCIENAIERADLRGTRAHRVK